MIAAIKARLGFALNGQRAPAEDQCFASSDGAANSFPLVAYCPGKAIGEVFLVRSQDVDRVSIHGLPRWKASRAAVDTEQDQRRIERDGIE